MTPRQAEKITRKHLLDISSERGPCNVFASAHHVSIYQYAVIISFPKWWGPDRGATANWVFDVREQLTDIDARARALKAKQDLLALKPDDK